MRIVVGMARSSRREDDADDGFSLIEVMVALGLIVFAMLATTGFFLRSMATGSLQQQRQAAVAMAERVMEQTRAVPARELLAGRYAAGNDALWATPGSVNLTQNVELSDSAATSASTPTVPFTLNGATAPAYRVANVDYTVRTFVDGCYLPATAGTCDKTAVANSALMYRVTVDVQWTPGRGQTCPGTGTQCEYVISTLRDPTQDSSFNVSNSNG